MEKDFLKYPYWSRNANIVFGRSDCSILNKKTLEGYTLHCDAGEFLKNAITGGKSFRQVIECFKKEAEINGWEISSIDEFLSVLQVLKVHGLLKISENKKIRHLSEPDKFLDMQRKFIRKLQVEITGQCNFYCEHCMTNSSIHITKALPIDILFERIKELVTFGKLSQVCLTGGEPFLHNNIFELVHKLSEIVEVHLISNISTHNFEKHSEIFKHISGMRVSLYGSSRKDYALFCKEDAYYRVLNNLKWLSKHFKDKTHVFIPITAMNKDPQKRIAICSSLKLDWQYSLVAPLGRALRKWSELKLDNDVYRKMCNDDASKLSDIAKNKTNLRRIQCTCDTAAINYEGDISYCPSMMMNPFIIGNIRNTCIPHSYAVCGLDKSIEGLFVDNRDGCKECSERYICAGGCPALTYAVTSKTDAKYPYCEKKQLTN